MRSRIAGVARGFERVSSHACRRWMGAGSAAVLFVLCGALSAAQSAPSATHSSQPGTKKEAHPTLRHSARHSKKKLMAKPAEPAPTVAAVPPPPPAPPDWPALSAPAPVEIHWDGKQLSVSAKNSSLKQAIEAVSATTHIPVSGLQSDQRLFGEYGPGTARQVLTELLEGSGYDLLMVGGKDPGIPQSVELSRRSGGSAPPERAAYTPTANSAVDPALAQQQIAPVQQAPPQPFNRPPGQTPQEMIQQRMQMIQQQQNAQQPRPQ